MFLPPLLFERILQLVLWQLVRLQALLARGQRVDAVSVLGRVLGLERPADL